MQHVLTLESQGGEVRSNLSRFIVNLCTWKLKICLSIDRRLLMPQGLHVEVKGEVHQLLSLCASAAATGEVEVSTTGEPDFFVPSYMVGSIGQCIRHSNCHKITSHTNCLLQPSLPLGWVTWPWISLTFYNHAWTQCQCHWKDLFGASKSCMTFLIWESGHIQEGPCQEHWFSWWISWP